MPFDPDAFLAEPSATAAPAFDPDAFLAEPSATAAPAFDPDAFLADYPEPQPAVEQAPTARQQALAKKQKELGRDLTDAEYTSTLAKISQDEAAARGDVAGAMKLSQSRAATDVAALDEQTAKNQVSAVRKPYLAVRGTMGGITLGASDIALRQIEKSAIGDTVQAESMSESMGENVGRLLGSVFTGASIASGMAKSGTGTLVKASELGGGITALIAKTGAQPFAQLVATRAATSLATMAPQEAAQVINGDKAIPDAIRDTAINALGSIVGVGPEIFVKPGVQNFLAQVTGQLAFDAASDAILTGRLTKENYKEWLVNEIPNLATAVIFSAKDLTDKDFAAHQGKYRKDAMDMFSRKVKAQATIKPHEYGPDVQSENGKSALKVQQETQKLIKESYPLDTHENVTAAIKDLTLTPELTALHDELDRIRLELKFGERVAGRIPQKNERGEIIGWMDAGAAYPGGLGADTLPAIRNYLDGKPLTNNQQRQLAAAVKHTINELSGQAGFDIANQMPVYSEDMRTGDQIELSGEKFTVKEVDPETGNITLKDGKLVTLKMGETILADRNSHLDADGKPAADRPIEEPAPFDPDAFLADQDQPAAIIKPVAAEDSDISFNPDEFLNETAPARHDIGDGIAAEKTPEGHWELTDADGNRHRLDPTVAEDYAMIQQIDPEARSAEVKRIATETAEKLPGAKIHFIDDQAAMDKVRTNLGEAVKEIRAEDGSVRGFAVIGTGDYFILTRNMRPDQAAATVIHEAVGHIGVRGVLGDRIDTVLDGIYSSKTEHDATLKRIARDYKLDLTTQAGRREAIEELIAHIAERRDKDPGAWKRLVARFKDYFRQLGFEWAQNWTDQDILALIRRGKERVSRPESAKSSNKFEIRLRKNPLKTSDETDTVFRMSESGADAQNKGLPQSKPGKSGSQITPEQDRAYLDAVERGDTAEAQRMVGEAAKAAGYGDSLWHGSEKSKTQFEPFTHIGTRAAATSRLESLGVKGTIHNVIFRNGNFVRARDTGTHTPIDIGHEIGGIDLALDTLRAYLKNIDAKEIEDISKRSGFSEKASVDELVEEARDRYNRLNQKPIDLVEMLGDVREYINKKAQDAAFKIVSNYAANNKIDGIVYKNEIEDAGKDSRIIFNPSNIKSADPITRDANGKVIPLSQRFNPSRSDTGAQTIRQAKQPGSGLTKADREMLMKTAKQRLYGRPDLSQVTTSKQTRALVAEVDQSRNEKGQPTPQTFKTWKSDADTRMQKDTTGEWLQFLSGKLHYEGDDAGQNTMVARKLLESKGLEAFASGDDAEIAKVGAAIWGYRNTRSNLARALAAGRDFLETPAERNRRWIAEALYYPGAKVDQKLQGLDLKSMQAELQKRAGKMQEIRAKLLDMGIDLGKLDEKTLNDPHAMAEIVRQIQISNAGYGDMVYEYWRNAILSAPATQTANITGNILSTTWQYTAQKGTEALINAMLGRKDGTMFRELPGMYRALWAGKQKAARNAMTAFSTEQGSIEGIRLDDKGVAIPGKAGRIIRTPQRFLLAADEFSKTMIIQAEMYSRAHQEAYSKGWRGDGLDRRIKEILADPKSEMMTAAIDEAKRLVFQAEPGEITMWLMKSRSIPGLQWVSKYVMPFVSTPTNIVKMGIKKTPLGLLRMAKQAATGQYKVNRQALVRDSAEQMLAMATTLALISLVNDEDEKGRPRITGSAPSGGKNAGKQQAEQRDVPAQSIRLGQSYSSYSRIEPLATAITHTIDVIEAIKNKPGEDLSDQLGRIVSSMKSLARDKTFLATIGDIIKATEDDSKGISLIQNFASSWIPNIIRSGARATDPYYRSSKLMKRDDKNVAQELATNIGQASIPLARFQDAPRMDYWGRPLQKTEGFGPATDIIWRMISPITVQHIHEPENFDRMFFNYNRKAVAKGWEEYWPAMPGNAFELPGARGIERTAQMNPDEYSRFMKRRGDFFFTLAAGKAWRFEDPGTMEIAEFKKLMAKATVMAKNDIYQERKMNPVSKSLKLSEEAKRPRPIIKPLPSSRPMMTLDENRRSL